MNIELNLIPTIVFASVMICWMIFAGVFIFRRKPSAAATTERKRVRASLYGIALQVVAYTLAWTVRRKYFTPIAPLGLWLEIALGILTVALAIASAWLVEAAVRTLGKQWSFAARLVEEHKLVTEGPYNLVRNPIYTGMFGMLIATTLAVTHWVAILPALIIFYIGTLIRVRSEEKLLREAFPTEFDDYARRVPAILPFPR